MTSPPVVLYHSPSHPFFRRPAFNYQLTPDILSIAATATSDAKRVITVKHGSPRTDGINVYLPGIKDDLTPRDAILLRGYFDHETAHIRYNSFSALPLLWPGSTEKVRNQRHTMFNAVEDVRIEAVSCHELPGTVGPLKAINDALLTADRSGENLSSYMQACHAIAWHGQGVGRDRASYCPQGWAILDRIDLTDYNTFLYCLAKNPLLQSAEEAAAVAIVLTDRVLAAIQELKDEVVEPPVTPPPPGESGESGESGEDSDSGDSDPGESGDPGDPGESGESGDSGAEDSDSGDGESGESSESGDPGESDDPGNGISHGGEWDDTPADPEVSSKAEGISDMVTPAEGEDEVALGEQYADAVTTASHIRESGRGRKIEYRSVHSGAMRIAGTLREQLMSRDRAHWSLPRESGHRIDRRALPGVASGQTVNAFNRRRVDRATKTKVTILLDESYSMKRRMLVTKQAAWTIADATEILGCPTEILGFSDFCSQVKVPGRVTSATSFNGEDRGGTELLPALITERVHAEAHAGYRRVVFVLSDGGTSASEACEDFIKKQRKQGVTYFAVCIDMRRKAVHDACNAVIECRADDVAGSMHRALLTL